MKSIEEMNTEFLTAKILLLYHRATKLYLLGRKYNVVRNKRIDKAFESELNKLIK